MAVFSCASGLYVFPAIELYYSPAIRLYSYEKANGLGAAKDLVIQGFIRYITIAFFPILVSTSMIYLMVQMLAVCCMPLCIIMLPCIMQLMLQCSKQIVIPSLQLIKYTAYSLIVYLQVLVVNICLNLTWTSLLIALIMTFPKVAFRISSVVASIAGFASGFFIPIGNIHWGYVCRSTVSL